MEGLPAAQKVYGSLRKVSWQHCMLTKVFLAAWKVDEHSAGRMESWRKFIEGLPAER